jgi:hypothetical protein
MAPPSQPETSSPLSWGPTTRFAVAVNRFCLRCARSSTPSIPGVRPRPWSRCWTAFSGRWCEAPPLGWERSGRHLTSAWWARLRLAEPLREPGSYGTLTDAVRPGWPSRQSWQSVEPRRISTDSTSPPQRRQRPACRRRSAAAIAARSLSPRSVENRSSIRARRKCHGRALNSLCNSAESPGRDSTGQMDRMIPTAASSGSSSQGQRVGGPSRLVPGSARLPETSAQENSDVVSRSSRPTSVSDATLTRAHRPDYWPPE